MPNLSVKKKLVFKITTRLEAGKEIEFICKELEKRFPEYNFFPQKKRIVPKNYNPNPNYGP